MKRYDLTQAANTTFDLLVIGGGITGACCARDAAQRGLSVILIEKDDFASGTSSRSSKMVHGGLRYLQTFQFRLVAEGVRERERTLKQAPHLTHIQPFLYLLYKGDPESKWMLNLGLSFYDIASGAWIKRRHKMLDARQVLELEPHLAQQNLIGAGFYYDALTDDSRLTLATISSASEAGASIVNHALATRLLLENGQVRGAIVRDKLTNIETAVHARTVVNASGPWSDQILDLETTRQRPMLRPTKGVHIVLRKSDFPLSHPVFLRSSDDNRVVWPTPSLEGDVVYIGTTDSDFEGDVDDVRPNEKEVQYLINVANKTIPDAQLTPAHVVGSWAGLRPLVAPSGNVSTSNTSRGHVLTVGPKGLITIAGGKLTSSRAMARDAIDAAVKKLGKQKAATPDAPLPGADLAAADRAHAAALAAGVDRTVADAWKRRYGSQAVELLRYWEEDQDKAVFPGARSLTRAEIRYLVDNEMVETISDLLIRRVPVFFWEADGGLGQIDSIGTYLAQRLGWDIDEKNKQISKYSRLVQSHRFRDIRPH